MNNDFPTIIHTSPHLIDACYIYAFNVNQEIRLVDVLPFFNTFYNPSNANN